MSEKETEKKTSEVEKNEVETKEEKKEETVTGTTEKKTSNESSGKAMWKFYVISVLAVVIVLLGVLFKLESEGRSSTNLFGPIIEYRQANAVVAVVDGIEIINSDLEVSVKQFSQMATAQGVDLTNPDAAEEIRTQALDVLVNTLLLKQAAAERGITKTTEDVDARLTEIVDELGGEDVLQQRLEVLGINSEKLRKDVEEELLIQELLDQVFSEAEIEVTEEEVASVYEQAGGGQEGVPPLEEVRGQIENQIISTKQQEIVDGFLGELKEAAEIELN